MCVCVCVCECVCVRVLACYIIIVVYTTAFPLIRCSASNDKFTGVQTHTSFWKSIFLVGVIFLKYSLINVCLKYDRVEKTRIYIVWNTWIFICDVTSLSHKPYSPELSEEPWLYVAMT